MAEGDNPQGVSRRSALKTSGTAALIAAAHQALPSGALAAGAGPEVTGAKLGFIALTDAAPLIIAKELGFFAKYGMPDVQVFKQASWGATRDNLVLGTAGGGIDGAHILTPMPYMLTLGTIGKATPMSILARLNVNGQGISVSKDYLGAKADINAGKMKGVIAQRRGAGKKITMAMTFPGGTHDLWIRYWLAAGGIDPDKDVELITIPPAQMVANMKADAMDAFCVGEPWNDQLVAQGLGYSAVSTGQMWMNHPEKSFAMRSDWVAKNPRAAVAITAAVIEAQRWADNPANNARLASTIAGRDYLKCPVTDIADRLMGNFNMGDGRKFPNAAFKMKFFNGYASFPYKSHDLWFLTEDQRWGKLPMSLDTKAVIAKVNRSDIWRKAAAAMGGKGPASDSRGVEKFFDGKTFDPANPKAYLASLAIKRV
ncbi:ABC-type nitrate/sulfonate/bicarbonate transport system periplasmic component [Sphingobium herbicidovorans NBRC 16415]|uniref:ABC-type nitrate/sulfonate/bicarbonate transport system periplasmic component n=1 Tax=Sphingobium herbicidovorans (strain ATCC 700291 / DSM 11019 / CCUG 56400 / KCTC 2939 / LMG 18315 / NBRC 16415 / MH) TaxID=1219045 RepID=A0A086P9S0_SPHHM|nr:CmpA/NrtA family ABC transporter substrate-binding protein [Sphingobium herbicidovorans]KFG90138.1 ABC-type nitrate/sulfonate/bicarbonate transport system periplasmic component [Sphingobium herbicidovorans NBRC 16415]